MRGLGIKKHRVPRFEQMRFIAMAISHSALQHVNQLSTGMLKNRKHLGLIGDSNHVRFNRIRLANGVAKQLILMTCAGAAALDNQTLTRFDDGNIALFFVATSLVSV